MGIIKIVVLNLFSFILFPSPAKKLPLALSTSTACWNSEGYTREKEIHKMYDPVPNSHELTCTYCNVCRKKGQIKMENN